MGLLKDTEGNAVPKENFAYTNDDKAILHQYKGAMMPSYLYSMFAQERRITVQNHFFEICYTIQKMKKAYFSIPSDISHKIHTCDLMKRERLDLVKSPECSDIDLESKHEQVLEMAPCIARACSLYCKDIATHLGLTEKDGNDADQLPDPISVAANLNPMMGGKTQILEASLMTESQHSAAIDTLLSEMQHMQEQQETTVSSATLDSDAGSTIDEFDDDVEGPSTSIAYQLSERELASFEKYK